jgi:dTDP-4-amino-4,6-dideoxygalactose transaminase
MRVPLVDLSKVHGELETEIFGAIRRVIATSAFAGGPEVEAFESRFAEFCGTRHCVGVSSGTAALELILRAAGIGDGQEVIVPVNSFVADAEAVILAGATPVFVDCVESTGLIDLEAVAAAVTRLTSAILPVHLYGQPVEMSGLQALAASEGLLLIEDACQAHGARVDGRQVGSLGDAAAFSFYPSKNLAAMGDAGAVTTDDEALAERLRMIRDHGSREKYSHEVLGGTHRMDGIQAAVLNVKLGSLDRWNDQRRQIAARYRAGLGSADSVVSVKCLEDVSGGEHVYHLFVVRSPERDAVLSRLHDAGVGAAIHYPVPLHRQPSLSGLGYATDQFPVANRLAAEILSLPIYPGLSDDQIDRVLTILL